MTRKILLLRGINVGGKNKLPMKELVEILSSLEATDIQTYIQSGNALFFGDISNDDISNAIEKAKGFRPTVLLLDLQHFRDIAVGHPFPKSEADGKTHHIWFLTAPAHFDKATAETLAKPNERFHGSDHAIYLHAPDGIGRSKLAEKLEKLAGVPTTARNWNTIAKLLEMADA